MNALQFDYSLPKYILSKALGKFAPSIYWHPMLSCLRMRPVQELELPNDEWVKIKIKFGGICGSDLNLIHLNDSPATSPFVSFPFTIGHEVVGTISEAGKEVKNFKVGDRVVVDPVLSCNARGILHPCTSCQKGDYSLCENKMAGNISPGLLIGACRDTGGSWGPYIVAHQSQVLSLPKEVDDLNGVLVEPFSCALHAVLRNPPQKDDTVLVIGTGTIGICVIAAIKALNYPCRIVAMVKHSFQAELAAKYGADEIIRLGRGAEYVEQTAQILQAKILKPLFGDAVIQGGADLVFECVGRKKSMNDAFRFTKSGGKIVLLGLASVVNGIDWTNIWLNELDVKGSFAYSSAQYEGQTMRTLEIAIKLMQEGKVDLSPLVTHKYPLEKYEEAFKTITQKGRKPAIKVVFEPNQTLSK